MQSVPLLRPETVRAAVCAVVVLLWLGLALGTAADASDDLHRLLLAGTTVAAALGCWVRALVDAR